MKARFLSVIMMSLSVIGNAFAQTAAKPDAKAPFPRMEFKKAPAENYELKACDGHATMVIDAANGARIMSLKWDSTEVLSQIPVPNMYGSTFWTSPQKEWNWPPVYEHDMAPYTVEQRDGKIVMTGSVPERIPLRITKTFSVVKDVVFAITYTITNEGKEDRQVAPWEVTRVPGEGEISFDADVREIWPAGLMNFEQQGRRAVFNIDKVDKQRKINAHGWPGMAVDSISDAPGFYDSIYDPSSICYRHNNLLFTKLFKTLRAGEAAPGEDEIQVYLHQNSLYCELEAQGRYTLLHPGEHLEWTVFWALQQSK